MLRIQNYVRPQTLEDAYQLCQKKNAVVLGGMWNTTIILADMDSYTYWTYTKDAGGFGLDVVGFCTVGLITSIGAFLGAVIAGKRSGGRFGLLALVAGICAAFFLLMISNNLNL